MVLPTFSLPIFVKFLFSIEILFSDISSNARSLIFEIRNLWYFFDKFLRSRLFYPFLRFTVFPIPANQSQLFLRFSIQTKHASPECWRDPSDSTDPPQSFLPKRPFVYTSVFRYFSRLNPLLVFFFQNCFLTTS